MKDLNLLRVFDAVWATRSVSKAAERLALTQPAVSSALARLRKVYADPLFTRVGSTMAPTPFCTEQAHYLLDALALVDRSLADIKSFDHAKSQRTFMLRMQDIGEVCFMPTLLAHCKKAAPQISFRTTFPPLEVTRQGLADGRIDLAVGYLPGLEAGIHRREMFMASYVCVMRKGHPLTRKALGLAEMAAAEYLMVEYSGTGHSNLERELREAGIARRVRLRIPQYLAAPHVVATTDLLWIVPGMLAGILAKNFPLAIRPCPLHMPAFPVAVYWHDRFHRDPANQWLRQTFAALFNPPPTALA